MNHHFHVPLFAPLRTNSAAEAHRGIQLHLLQVFVDRGWSAIGTIRPRIRDDSSVDDGSFQFSDFVEQG